MDEMGRYIVEQCWLLSQHGQGQFRRLKIENWNYINQVMIFQFCRFKQELHGNDVYCPKFGPEERAHFFVLIAIKLISTFLAHVSVKLIDIHNTEFVARLAVFSAGKCRSQLKQFVALQNAYSHRFDRFQTFHQPDTTK